MNRARLRISRQVVLSRVDDPLEPVTVQALTRPSVPMVSRNRVVPCSSRDSAEAG